jgi:hypothetical protein
MIEFEGHVDGRAIIPDQPLPLRAGERWIVRVKVEAEAPRPGTAGELTALALDGVWADRTDIVGSTEFSRELRRKIERRESMSPSGVAWGRRRLPVDARHWRRLSDPTGSGVPQPMPPETQKSHRLDVR